MAGNQAIAIYGASGYTGKLVAQELKRRGLPMAIVGRNYQKLTQMNEQLQLNATVKVALLDDPGGLRHALGDCSVVINCAGPFTLLAQPVVKAAIETATHYIDITAEQQYIDQLFDRYTEAAKAAEVAVIPAAGLDYLASDLLAQVITRGHQPLDELVIATLMDRLSPTRGTMHSLLEMLCQPNISYEDGQWRDAGLFSIKRGQFAFPNIGRRPVIGWPSGELALMPRHINTKKVTPLLAGESGTIIDLLTPVLPFIIPFVRLGLRTPLRSLLDELVANLPEGPTEQQRQQGNFLIAVVAYGQDGSVGSGYLNGFDPYGFTAISTSHAAQIMSDPNFNKTGVLTPAEAFDPDGFLNELQKYQVNWEITS